MAFLLCDYFVGCCLSSLASCWAAETTASYSKQQRPTYMQYVPDISQKYLHTTEKPQSSSHTVCNKHWYLPGFSVFWYTVVMFGVWISIQIKPKLVWKNDNLRSSVMLKTKDTSSSDLVVLHNVSLLVLHKILAQGMSWSILFLWGTLLNFLTLVTGFTFHIWFIRNISCCSANVSTSNKNLHLITRVTHNVQTHDSLSSVTGIFSQVMWGKLVWSS
jgi:hypothetical protein